MSRKTWQWKKQFAIEGKKCAVVRTMNEAFRFMKNKYERERDKEIAIFVSVQYNWMIYIHLKKRQPQMFAFKSSQMSKRNTNEIERYDFVVERKEKTYIYCLTIVKVGFNYLRPISAEWAVIYNSTKNSSVCVVRLWRDCRQNKQQKINMQCNWYSSWARSVEKATAAGAVAASWIYFCRYH